LPSIFSITSLQESTPFKRINSDTRPQRIPIVTLSVILAKHFSVFLAQLCDI
jgi:hypothetical protein